MRVRQVTFLQNYSTDWLETFQLFKENIGASTYSVNWYLDIQNCQNNIIPPNFQLLQKWLFGE